MKTILEMTWVGGVLVEMRLTCHLHVTASMLPIVDENFCSDVCGLQVMKHGFFPPNNHHLLDWSSDGNEVSRMIL